MADLSTGINVNAFVIPVSESLAQLNKLLKLDPSTSQEDAVAVMFDRLSYLDWETETVSSFGYDVIAILEKTGKKFSSSDLYILQEDSVSESGVRGIRISSERVGQVFSQLARCGTDSIIFQSDIGNESLLFVRHDGILGYL